MENQEGEPHAQRISAVQLELLLLSEIGITGLKFVIHSGMAGWLWWPFPPDVSGVKTTGKRREPAERTRRKVQMGLFVCIRAETLVSTALPIFLSCLRLKWESIFTLQLTPHLPCNLILCFSLFLQIHQFMDAQ